MLSEKKLGWGFIGASDIAKTRMLEAINSQPDSSVTAVMSSSPERARRYAAENGIPRAYSSIDDLLADPSVDVVYISTQMIGTKEKSWRPRKPGSIPCAKNRWLSISRTREKWLKPAGKPAL